MTVDTHTVEMAFGGAPHTPTGWTWTDITEWVISVTTNRGRESRLEQVSPGTMSITVDNSDGRFDPSNLTGPYTSGGETLVRPKTPVRLTVDDDWGGPTVTYDLFNGYLDDTVTLTHIFPETSVVIFTATDASGWLGLYDLPQLDNPIEDGTTASVRATRILTDVGFTDVNTYDMNGDTILGPTIDGGNAAEALNNIALAEGGAVWVTADGVLTMDDRYATGETRRTSTQAQWRDTAGFGTFSEMTTAINRNLYNVVTMTNERGGQFSSSDATSIGLYGKRTYDISGAPLKYDAPAESRVEYWLKVLKDPYIHVASITVRVHGGSTGNTADNYNALKGATTELFDRVRVEYTPPRTPPASNVSESLFVERIQHTIEGGTWTYRLGFETKDRFEFDGINPFGWMELDNPSKGLDSIYVLSY